MNILISNLTGLVCYGTYSVIYVSDTSWASDGVKIGILVDDAILIENVDSPEIFIPNVYSYNNNVWTIENKDLYDSVIAMQKLEFNNTQKKNREAAYKAESDPINFMMQRGEATQEEWLAKIDQIKKRYPYQE